MVKIRSIVTNCHKFHVMNQSTFNFFAFNLCGLQNLVKVERLLKVFKNRNYYFFTKLILK